MMMVPMTAVATRTMTICWFSGSPAVDTAALADVLLRVSRLADDVPEIAELDLNPVIARPDGVQAVDARIRIVPAHPQDPFLRRLR